MKLDMGMEHALVSTLALLLLMTIGVSGQCPQDCSCKTEDITDLGPDYPPFYRGLVVWCERMTTVQFDHFPTNAEAIHIRDSPAALTSLRPDNMDKFQDLKKLELWNCGLQNITAGAFAPMKKICNIKFRFNPLEEVDANSFLDCYSLYSVSISRSRINSTGVLRSLTVSHNLDFSENEILDFHVENFPGLWNLTNLVLKGNRIRSIGLISKMKGLTYVDFSNNELKTIPTNFGAESLTSLRLEGNGLRRMIKNQFVVMSRLKYLWLDDNTMEFIHPKAFGRQTALQGLHLSKNLLTEIDKKTFSGMPALTYLYIDRNSLYEWSWDILVGNRKLQYLRLWKNQIERMIPINEKNIFPNLETVDLADNKLENLPSNFLSMFPDISQEIHLGKNELTEVEATAFEGLTKLKRLLLFDNHLSSISESLKAAFSNVSFISLGGNPLHCNCELVWVKELATSGGVYIVANCVTPFRGTLQYILDSKFECILPEIEYIQANSSDPLDLQMELLCHAIGDPAPIIMWASTLGNVILDDIIIKNKSIHMRTSHLEIQRHETLNVIYSCIASNTAGNSTSYFFIPRQRNPELRTTTQMTSSSPSQCPGCDEDRLYTDAHIIGAILGSVISTFFITAILMLLIYKNRKTYDLRTGKTEQKKQEYRHSSYVLYGGRF